jgi:hypothetical protein
MERKPVRYIHLIRRLGLLWIVPPLAFAAIFGGIGVMELNKSLLLAREGVQVDGVVVAKWVDIVERDKGVERTHRIRYEYTPAERGTVITRTENVSEKRYRRESVGTPIVVHYAWSQPDKATLDPRRDRFGAVIFSFFAVIAGAVGLGLAIWMIGRKMSAIRALRHGEVREARVTGHHQTSTQVNKVWQFQMEWVDAAGTKGRSLMAPMSKLAAYPVGSVIVVYVDPKTGRGWWDVQV